MFFSPMNDYRVRSFGMIRIRISDPRSLGSWCIKKTAESFSRVDSSVFLMHYDPSGLGSLILSHINPKERIHSFSVSLLHFARDYGVMVELLPNTPSVLLHVSEMAHTRVSGPELEKYDLCSLLMEEVRWSSD